MKKRLFAMTLAVLMLCSLMGCGGNTDNDKNDNTTTTTQMGQDNPPISMMEGELPAGSVLHMDPDAVETNETVLLKANTDLTDLRFLALGANTPMVEKVLYTLSSIDEGQHWAIRTYINDAVPNRGVACTDKDGKTYYYAITQSGKDGSLSLTELDIAILSEERLTEIETMLNAEENNGFVSMNEYTCPEEVSLFDALYSGAGIGVGSWDWTDEEVQDYLAAIGLEEVYIPVLRFKRGDVEALLQKKLGISIADLTKDIDMRYIEKYDAYYHSHSDTQYQPVEVLSGWLEGGEGGFFIVDYKIGWGDDEGRVVLKLIKDGYQFVSNAETSAAINTTDLSTTQLDEINTFLNDPDNLGFVQRTFDRPQEVNWGEVLTADVTFGVYQSEWSEAEWLALLDACGGDFTGSPIRYPRADVDELFQKRLGLLPTELDTPIRAPYLEEYDAYYCFFLGIEWVPVSVTGGRIENGIYIVDYDFGYYSSPRQVTMRATDDGFQFISNVSIKD